MELKQRVIRFIVVWSCCLLCCTGCVSQVKVALNYVPAGTGLLSDLKPAIISLQIVDERPPEQRHEIGVQRNTVFGTRHAGVVSKTDAVQAVRSALKTELERSGHRVLDSKAGRAEIDVNVALTQFFFDSKAAGEHIELVANVQADVVVSTSAEKVPQDSFIVEGSYRDSIQMGLVRPTVFWGMLGALFCTTPKSRIEKVLNGSLAEFVRRFCLEPKLRRVFRT